MADAPKINPKETLRESYPKLNQAIDNANEAITKATTADENASQAVTTANSVQEQFNQVVIEGDSSVEAAQARVSYTGTTYTTLKERLDQEHESVTTQLADIALKTDFGVVDGVGDGETSDSAYIQQVVNNAGYNQKIYLPKPPVAYVITTPIILRQGQTLEFAVNTKVYDRTDDYAFKIEGGPTFAVEAKTHVTICNAEIIGNPNSKGAIYARNVYLINFEKCKIHSYSNLAACGVWLEDFFQINFYSTQVNNIENGKGLYINAVTGNSGQVNLYNSIIQRSRIGLHVEGTGNVIDGVNMFGGAIGNNHEVGLKIGKNVHNFTAFGSHIENHDGITFAGTTAVDMFLDDGLVCEGVTFIACLFENNKYAIKSNNSRRVTLIGNQFKGNGIEGAVAITQGDGDGAWFISPNMFDGYETEIIEKGINHTVLRNLNVDYSGALFPQRSSAGIYSGDQYPEGKVTAKQGSIYLRTNGGFGYHVYIKNSGDGNTGWQNLNGQIPVYTNANRPGANTVPRGTVIFNSDDNMPNYSDGATWRDALGNIT
ncbi:hypothetical protein [Caldibacillus thermoamylovorans]|uniref:hypothetical protein n=1 Tax=Caldibacillus thermoamylovorans TaxID=35841 RepID=UPI0022E5613E|nr:hypothetical protein [Caldibacillus thermoamylovorans]